MTDPALPTYSIRAVAVPHYLEWDLFRALLDVRRGVNRVIPDWRGHPDESRFEATKRSYPILRARYPHLASSWSMTIANETSAALNAWDRSLRRAKRADLSRFERMRSALPQRRALKACLHTALFRWKSASSSLNITIRPGVHAIIDLSAVKNPLFREYGEAPKWHFGLTLRPRAVLFHFRVPHTVRTPDAQAGVDLNLRSANVAMSDGSLINVDLSPITRVQERMARKRLAIARQLSKDGRHQRAVLRRYNRRERNRVTPLLHQAANELLKRVGERIIVLEDLTDPTDSIQRRERGHRGPHLRRQLSSWTHGRLMDILSYKSSMRIVFVNPEGTSSECPRCGAQSALPSGGGAASRGQMSRQTVCVECGGRWHRDAAAAIAVLSRGRRLLRGKAVTPSARNALLEAGVRPTERDRETRASPPGLTAERMKEDDAKSGELRPW